MEEKVLAKGIFNKNFGKYCVFSLIGMFAFICLAGFTGAFALMAPGMILGICFYIFLFLFLFCSKVEMTVTDKRIFGKAIFKRRVDLPLDKISSVDTCMFNGIGVATSSGRMKFLFCKNRDEVFDVISKLLFERQNQQKPNETIIKQETSQSNADELKKFKDLLDGGVITQEEFDQKKKQLLGL